jgi:hypothetical protein
MSKGGANRGKTPAPGPAVRTLETVVPPKEIVYTNPGVAVTRVPGRDGAMLWRAHFLIGGEMTTVVMTRELRDLLVRELTGVTLG